MRYLQRFGWFFLLFTIQTFYYPINRTMYGGWMFRTELDAYIPLWSSWVIPYLLWIPWWVVCFAWAAWKMEDRLYRAFVIAAVLVCVIGLATFVCFPTYVQRPFLGNQDDWSLELLHVVYANDRVYNAFPSGHVYITTLIGLFWTQWFPRYRWWWRAIIVVIAFSTLFTHQHYLPDPVGGMLLAWAGYRFGLWWVDYPGPDERTRYQPEQESVVQT